MLETLSKGFKNAANRLRGYKTLSESNIDEALRDIRLSLLEADVEFHVVKAFLNRLKDKAVGEVVKLKAKSKKKQMKVSPGEHFIKLCHDELVELMGPVDTSLALDDSPSVIMMVGLQGSGKTTTVGKLASYLVKEHGKRPLLVAGDIYRPAAVDQLQVLGQRLELPVFAEPGVAPPDLAKSAIEHAKLHRRDVVIVDTAGRLAIDEELMQELEDIKAVTKTKNIFLVLDAMIGQDSVRTASEFNRRLDVDGIILTKLDGDARGGAALSVKEVTGKPIKFLGMGEAMDRLEEFRPEGLADRILGFGDIVGLMKDFEDVVDQEQAEKEAEKILKGEFNFHQFLEQIRTIKKMGSLQDVMEKMPFFSQMMPDGARVDDNELVRIESMIQSMTEQERTKPSILNDSRKERIARGAGRDLGEVDALLKKFDTMRTVFQRISKTPGILGNIPGFKQLFQMRQLKGMDSSDIFGENMPAMDMDDPKQKKKPVKKFDKQKARKKQKQARKARKKGRKK